MPNALDETQPPHTAADKTECLVGFATVRPPWRLAYCQGHCTCGWLGPRRRLIKALAALDALTHARERGGTPRYPLATGSYQPAGGDE